MKPLNLVQGRAEKMMFEDESFDILNCVYLFHELPAEVRRECAKEFFRVLRPGGMVAWCDSIQANDRESLPRERLSIFSGKYHEPYYNDYIEDDIDSIFLEAGFVKGYDPIIANRSKVMSWVKPGEFKVDPDMIKPEGWTPTSRYTTAGEEIKAKFETSKENRKEYLKEKKEKMNKKSEEKAEERSNEFNKNVVEPITEIVQETVDEIVSSTGKTPEEKEEKITKWRNVVKKTTETVEAVESLLDEKESEAVPEPDFTGETE
jgi:SAM-dependent methyltransferase